MKLKFITKEKTLSENFVLIGKNGILRFKTKHVNSMNLVKNELWDIGIDEEENRVKNFYLKKSILLEKNLAWKVQQINGNFLIDIQSLILKFHINVPVQCVLTEFSKDNFKGYKMEILNKSQV